MRKLLIGQLACFGDCLYATTVAKQIKVDYPDSHITWAIASKYKSIIELNPHVDEIWEITAKEGDYYEKTWLNFVKEARQKKENGIYDELIFTQVPNYNWKNFDGTIRSSIINAYKKPITVSVEPVLRLSQDEIKNVKTFAQFRGLSNYKHVILFECSPGSGQSFVNVDLALEIAKIITTRVENVCFILSTHKKLTIKEPHIFGCSQLSFRENAELTKFCTLLIGCSSGITWISTSDWAKKLNMVQLLSGESSIFAGIKYDHEIWNLDTTNIIEITRPDISYVINCVCTILEKDFETAKNAYDEVYKPDYANFRYMVGYIIGINKGLQIFSMIAAYYKRNQYLNLLPMVLSSFSIGISVYKKKFFNVFNKSLKRLYS